MFIKPLMDRVLIEPVEVEQKVGAIVLAGDNKVPYLHGIVIAKGPGKQKANGEHVPIPLELGQTVIYGNVSSTLEDMVDGKKVFLVEQNAIVGIIHESYEVLSKEIKEDLVDDVQDNIVPRTPASLIFNPEGKL